MSRFFPPTSAGSTKCFLRGDSVDRLCLAASFSSKRCPTTITLFVLGVLFVQPALARLIVSSRPASRKQPGAVATRCVRTRAASWRRKLEVDKLQRRCEMSQYTVWRDFHSPSAGVCFVPAFPCWLQGPSKPRAQTTIDSLSMFLCGGKHRAQAQYSNEYLKRSILVASAILNCLPARTKRVRIVQYLCVFVDGCEERFHSLASRKAAPQVP